MKSIFLFAATLLMFNLSSAQTADYYVKNGNLMVNKGNSTSTFETGSYDPIIDFADGTLNGKNYLIYWTSKGKSYMCTLREDGKWSSKSDFDCQCRKNISKIKFIANNTLMITCSNGNRFKKTIGQSGGGSESQQY